MAEEKINENYELIVRTIGNESRYKNKRKSHNGIIIYRKKDKYRFCQNNIKMNDELEILVKDLQKNHKNKKIKKGVSIIGFIPIKEKINKKAQNGQVADEEEKFLVQELNNPKTENYIAKEIIKILKTKLKTKYPKTEKFKFKFHKIGGRGNCFDINVECIISDKICDKFNFELKKVKNINIRPKNPLIAIPQFYQGNHGELRKFYILEWYNELELIKNTLNIKSEIPEMEEWIKYDTIQNDKNTTSFTRELKNICKNNDESKEKLKGLKNNFIKKLHKIINKNEENKIKYQKMVFNDYKKFATEALNKKDYYCLYNDINGDTCYLYDKICFPDTLKYDNFKLNEKSVNLSFTIEDKEEIFRQGMICWKNGTGIKNIAFKCI